MSKKILTKRQQTILTLIYAFRFINSKQIQTFLQHKDHRRINSWLKDLVGNEYIERDFTPVFGTLTKPAVYNLSPKGRAYIRNTYSNVSRKYLARLRDDKDRTKGYRIKCQILVDTYLILYKRYILTFPQTIEKWLSDEVTQRNDSYEFFTPAFFEELDSVLLNRLKPDAYCSSVQKDDSVGHAMIYILDAYIPRLMLRYILKRIFTTLDEESWEDDSTNSLQFYFICPNNMIIIYLKRILPSFLEQYYESTELIFHFATRNQLYNRKKYNTGKTGWIRVSSRDY